MEEKREKIIKGVLRTFATKGAQFTMDDLASELGMSKKTIYKVFKNKSEMFFALIDYTFDKIISTKKAIMNDDSLREDEKFKKMLIIIPSDIEGDLKCLSKLKDRFPVHYAKVQEYIEEGWSLSYKVMQECVKKGYFKDANPTLLKVVYQGAVVSLLGTKEIESEPVTHEDAMKNLVELLVEGIRT